MLRITRPLAAALLLASGAALGCLFPTDRSGELIVEASEIPPLLVRDTAEITARLVDEAGAEIPNAEISFASNDSTVVLVNAAGQVFALATGSATVSATAVGFDGTAPATQAVTVRGLLELDSVTPAVVRFGSLLTLWGIGLDTNLVFGVGVGGEEAPFAFYIPEEPDQPERFGALSVIVKPPAPRTSSVSVLSVNGGLVHPQTITVQQRDIYEPNDTTAWRLGELPLGMANPGLAFERRGRNDTREATDWYTFTNPTAGDRTIIVGGEGIGSETFTVFISDSLFSYGVFGGYFIGFNAWTIGPSTYFCGGLNPGVIELDFPLAIVALKDLPAGEYHVVVFYAPQPDHLAYTTLVANSYESLVPPDAAEENDVCSLAPTLTAGNRNLTTDNPHDIDWFRFSVPAIGQTVTFNLTAQDSLQDLDMYVYGDLLPASLPLYDFGLTVGTDESVSISLPGGDYFLVIVDYPGVAGRYTLSTAFSAPPAGAPAAARPIPAAAFEAAKARKRSATPIRVLDVPALRRR